MTRTSFLALALLTLGCNDTDFSCEDEREGNWAIQFNVDLTEDGECSYEGTVTEQESEASRDIVCEKSGDTCTCSGGTDFGTYEVLLTNLETDVTERAVIGVEPEASPICVSRDSIEKFAPVETTPHSTGGATN